MCIWNVACAHLPLIGGGGGDADDADDEDDGSAEDEAENGDEADDDSEETGTENGDESGTENGDEEEEVPDVLPETGSVGGIDTDTLAMTLLLLSGAMMGTGMLVRHRASLA